MVFTLPENSLDTVLARYHTGAKLPVEAWDRGDMKLQASGVLAMECLNFHGNSW